MFFAYDPTTSKLHARSNNKAVLQAQLLPGHLIVEQDIDGDFEDMSITNGVVSVNTTETLKRDIRAQRDALLAATDWWAVSDRTMTAAETTYRQDLRDVPSQSGFPSNVTWPTKP